MELSAAAALQDYFFFFAELVSASIVDSQSLERAQYNF
jgi:hypothetical protein